MSRKNDPLDTPFMRQYLEIKSGHPDAILFFRMGDFYELFLDDAKEAAPLMDVALTRRQNEIPMCGVPYHSANTYIERLLSFGKKIVIAEQVADPLNPKLMKRRVVRVLSAGTLIEDNLIGSSSASYLMAVAEGSPMGVAIADISTGEFFALEAVIDFDIVNQPDHAAPVLPDIRDLIQSYRPAEVLIASTMTAQIKQIVTDTTSITAVETYKSSAKEGSRKIESTFSVKPKALGFTEDSPALGAVSLILHYLDSAFPENRPQLEPPIFHESTKDRLSLDERTIRNLDILDPPQTSLLSLFQCRTAAGRRLLRLTLLHPLTQDVTIHQRLDGVELFVNSPDLLQSVNDQLTNISDLERILARVDGDRGRPQDFRLVIKSIEAANQLKLLLQNTTPFSFYDLNDTLLDFATELDSQVVDEPAALPGESPFLREGFDTELDEAKSAHKDGTQWLLDLEAKEKQSTGINTLKIRFNRVAGYYIEISKGQTQNAPDRYERKQTLVTGERYTSTELKEIERKILSADAIIEEAERKAFDRLIERLKQHRTEIRKLMSFIAQIDVLAAFANTSRNSRWTRPQIVNTGELTIEESRHPVVEKFLPTGVSFTPNDVFLNRTDRSFALLTGPNMAGKSTYIRQVAIIQLLAQVGCFVPARRAKLTPVDRIFTRIGAHDDLARGESTFFVEMLETSAILRRFSSRSLIIMDEVGRGTSTYDGLSIAWAVTEFLTEKSNRPAVLFATHYHELTALQNRPGFVNLTMDVRESAGKVIFLHRVKEGVADRSYGIHVARLAGLPTAVIDRASELLQAFESKSVKPIDTELQPITPSLEFQKQRNQEQPGSEPSPTTKRRQPATNDNHQPSLF